MMRVLRDSSDDEMIACFLQGELSSERFGPAIHDAMLARGQPETLVTHPNLADQHANQDRRAQLAATRGYGEDRELFEHFPAEVRWVRARLTGAELGWIRYVEYSYWNEISGGSRLATDAAERTNAGVRPWGVSHRRFHSAAYALLGASGSPADPRRR
jgi:hypothetical protein